MDSLSRIFGGAQRVKCLRLFLFNPSAFFSVADAASRTKLASDVVRKEISVLLAAGVLRKSGGKTLRYSANPRYKHQAALQEFLRATDGVSPARLLGVLRKAGTLRYVALSGFFTTSPESKIDLLVVGDGLSDRVLTRAISALEAELGREIRFAAFATPDFRYRIGVYDRLIRDVLDYPHQVLLDKIGL